MESIREDCKPLNLFVDYGLFVSLFPHLIAGPIQRRRTCFPQVQANRSLNADRFFDGMMLIFHGLLRKCVIADNCALLANAAFGGQFGNSTFWVVLIGAYAFAWQVYGDFSGYSDIARGSAQLLGFHFMINFRQPFLAQRFQELWRRWHISLSTWLRDYLYIPLGGSVGGDGKTCRNLLTTKDLAVVLGMAQTGPMSSLAPFTALLCLLSASYSLLNRSQKTQLCPATGNSFPFGPHGF